MSDLAENLFHNAAPFVSEIMWALVLVFVVSFAAGWYCARLPSQEPEGEEE